MATKPKVFRNEKGVKDEVKKLLNQHGWFWWMTPANGYGVSGISDFCALRGGVFLAIETKFGGNKVTQLQRGYLESVLAEAGFGFEVNEKNIGWFAVWLDAFDRMAAAEAKKEKPDATDGAFILDAIQALTMWRGK